MTEEMGLGLSQIEQIALTVQDVERAVAFYQTQLGMKHLFTSNGLAFFDCAGVRLMLSRPEGVDAAQASSIIYFKVEDIHRAYQMLSERSVKFEDKPHLIANMGSYELWMVFFRDSEGNLLALSGHELLSQ